MTKLWLRRILSAAIFASVVVLFVSSLPVVVSVLGWVPSLQLVPALLAGSVAVLFLLAVITLLFGRVYCSVICPLGFAQDFVRRIVTAIVAVFGKTKFRPHSQSAGADSSRRVIKVRYIMLALFIPALAFGFGFLIEPYAIFSRFMATIACDYNDFPISLIVFSVTFFAAIIVATFFEARWWCNTFCPVGAFLSIFQKCAVFRLRIDNAKCVGCDECAKKCDKGVIPWGKDKKLDHSRCVSCYVCSGSCKFGALSFGTLNLKKHSPQSQNT